MVPPYFFDRLHELLPEERTAAGVASIADCLVHEIPPLIDLLVVDYEAATGRPKCAGEDNLDARSEIV